MILPRLAFLSLRNRWLTALLTVIAIAVSVALLLGVEKVRTGARASFANTISGTDLIIGARTGDVQLENTCLRLCLMVGGAIDVQLGNPDVCWI